MSDTKMLRTIINGQSALKQEVLKKIGNVDQKVDKLDKKVDEGFKKVNGRLDKIGLSVAHLEDDVPTIEEFDNLEKRVSKLENQASKN